VVGEPAAELQQVRRDERLVLAADDRVDRSIQRLAGRLVPAVVLREERRDERALAAGAR
jgi:hypothetical protein